ncbi:hypothetical protein [Methylobacter sp.]|uniref:hypothetical protein n=1 Tax=Methylobacter sp. TaxID=2051955 RepID=UPI002FDF0083
MSLIRIIFTSSLSVASLETDSENPSAPGRGGYITEKLKVFFDHIDWKDAWIQPGEIANAS